MTGSYRNFILSSYDRKCGGNCGDNASMVEMIRVSASEVEEMEFCNMKELM